MAEALNVAMRWMHIASMATLIGGILYARAVLLPVAGAQGPSGRDIEEASAARFGPLVYAAICGLVLSGVYNIISRPGHTVRYHIILGIKLLLVLHVFAVMLLSVKPNNKRRVRMITGAAISGLIIIGISAYLRRIF